MKNQMKNEMKIEEDFLDMQKKHQKRRSIYWLKKWRLKREIQELEDRLFILKNNLKELEIEREKELEKQKIECDNFWEVEYENLHYME